MSNIDVLIADVLYLLSNAKITFSQGGATDLKKMYLAPGLFRKDCKLNFFIHSQFF